MASRLHRCLQGLLFCCLTSLGLSAHAAPITGGETLVQLDGGVAGAIIGAGVTPSAFGTGAFDINTLTFSFPVTGGDLSAAVIPGSSIEHDGSGITFSAGTTGLTIGNFVIDTDTLTITGFANSSNPAVGNALNIDSGVPLFTLATGSMVADFPFLTSLTDVAASVLNDTFGVSLFTPGLTIGVAATLPTVAAVPEPATLALLLLGLAAIGWRTANARQTRIALAPAAA